MLTAELLRVTAADWKEYAKYDVPQPEFSVWTTISGDLALAVATLGEPWE